MMLTFAIFVAVVAVLAIVAFLVVGSAARSTTLADGTPVSSRDLVELENLRALVDDLRETAWDHREIDPALSVIVIDKIRTFERNKHTPPRGELGS